MSPGGAIEKDEGTRNNARQFQPCLPGADRAIPPERSMYDNRPLVWRPTLRLKGSCALPGLPDFLHPSGGSPKALTPGYSLWPPLRGLTYSRFICWVQGYARSHSFMNCGGPIPILFDGEADGEEGAAVYFALNWMLPLCSWITLATLPANRGQRLRLFLW